MLRYFDFQELNSPAVKKDRRSYGLTNGLKKESTGTNVKSYHDDSDVVRMTQMDRMRCNRCLLTCTIVSMVYMYCACQSSCVISLQDMLE